MVYYFRAMISLLNIRVTDFKRLCHILLLAVVLVFFCACGERESRTSIIISGTIDGNAIDTYSDKAIMAAVAKASDFDQLSTDPLGAVVKYVSVDKATRSFSIDLFGSGLSPGEEVLVLAFIDTMYSGGIPQPDIGDIIGFYTDQEALSASLKLEEGINSGINITINREVFSFDSSISGTIHGNETGNLTIIAYAGEIPSSDFTDLDLDSIIGFKECSKGEEPLIYTMDILPYGFNIPIENVFIFAFLDVNQNTLMDSGDRIGYFSSQETNLPSPVTIEEGLLEEIDVHFFLDVNTDSNNPEAPLEADLLSVSGSILLPDAYTPDNGSVFVIVADPDSLETINDDPLNAVKYVKRLSPGTLSFTIDLSNSGLSSGEDIMLIGLWDRNNTGIFPDPDPGDYIGFYFNEDTFSTSYQLGQSEPNDIEIDINREVFDFSSEVTGVISGNKNGDTMLLAYAGEIDSLDFTALDFNSVVGFTTISEMSSETDYSLPIFPYGFNVPIENVYILALIDNNGNGIPDAGDAIGFHTDTQGQPPTLITVQEGTRPGIDIDTFLDIPTPSGHDISISGIIDPPGDYFTTPAPIFIIVANAEDVDDIFSDPLSAISYFEKLPEGETEFDIDLSATALVPEDEIILIALWDRDYEAGSPSLSEGDMAGLYQNKTEFRSSIVLSEINGSIPSGDWEFVINRNIFQHNAEISFSLEDGGGVSLNNGDLVTVIAIHEDGVDDTWPNLITPPSYDITDMDYIVGVQTMVVNEENNYSLTMLPAIFEGIGVGSDPFSINDIYVFALLDNNLNGMPDEGEGIGFYWQQFLLLRLPDTVNITDGVNILDKTVRFSE
jgi:hypothetical protein